MSIEITQELINSASTYQYIESVSQLILSVLAIAVLILFNIYLLKKYKDPNGTLTFHVISFVAALVFFISICITIPTVIDPTGYVYNKLVVQSEGDKN